MSKKKDQDELKKQSAETAAEEERAEGTKAEDGDTADIPGTPEEEKTETKEEPVDDKEDEDLKTKYLRLAADFQNFRKRTEKEKTDIYAFANEKFALSILDVIDNFERAMAAASPEDKFAEGMQLIFKQLQDVLTKNNVTEIKAEGEKFDPNFHNAVMTEAAGEGVESGTITKVFQKGYLLNNKVIRPSMVAVAQ